eukprot:26202_1
MAQLTQNHPNDIQETADPNNFIININYHNYHNYPNNDQTHHVIQNKATTANKKPTVYNLYHSNTTSGGTSFIGDMKKFNISSHDVNEFDWKKCDQNKYKYVSTLIRYPPSHLVSMWKHCSESPYNERRSKLFKNVPFDVWINYWSYLGRHYNHNASFEKEHFKTYRGIQSPTRYESWECYNPTNLQSARFGAFDFSSIKKRIEGIFHVGVQNMYHESLCVLLYKLNNQTHASCKCGADYKETKASHNVKPYKFETFINQRAKEDVEQ